MNGFNNLSESRMNPEERDEILDYSDIVYWEEDVKNFTKEVRQLLDDTMSGGCDREFVLKQFDTLAGDALCTKDEVKE